MKPHKCKKLYWSKERTLARTRHCLLTNPFAPSPWPPLLRPTCGTHARTHLEHFHHQQNLRLGEAHLVTVLAATGEVPVQRSRPGANSVAAAGGASSRPTHCTASTPASAAAASVACASGTGTGTGTGTSGTVLAVVSWLVSAKHCPW
jgi:hypothetical protein